VGKINDVAQASGLPVNFIFVSDHGMTKVDQEHPAVIPKVFADTQFVVNYQTAVANLYAKDPSFIQLAYEKLKAGEAAGSYDVYLSSDVPAELHYGAKDDKYKRVGDIIVIAAFKPHLHIAPFQNVEVYDVMTKILGIQPMANDGTGALAKEILK
jgi:predicted AlkP superfamily pyrophosphatase or phosphodiesterase